MKVKQGRNLLTAFFSGTIADQFVLRNRGSIQVLSARPKVDPNRPPTAAQLSGRERFKRAVAYAKAHRLDPAYVAAAELDPDRSAYSLALRDYMRPPLIDRIETQSYHGQPGDTIAIRVLDDFVVLRVTVELRREAAWLAGGPAVRGPAEGDWLYTGDVVLPAGPVDLLVRAEDKAGNRIEQRLPLVL